jgi:predicted DCC family thiol-disulfide oxidoreductase YuxK
MKKLFILYDPTCGLCIRAAAWLERQPAFFPIIPVARGYGYAQTHFPTLTISQDDELIAISDTGDVYRGHSAWLMCLYALKRYRPWSFRFAAPGMRHISRIAIRSLSEHRKDISHLLNLQADAARCETNSCRP